MNETFITSSITKFLKKNNFYIIQSIHPGGQGGLNYKVNNKPIYPDILAFKGEVFIIGENKPSYSESDHRKLNTLMQSKEVNPKSQFIKNKYCESKNIISGKILKIEFFLGFEESTRLPTDSINFYHVNKNENVKILQS
jgi:hypothetical protein